MTKATTEHPLSALCARHEEAHSFLCAPRAATLDGREATWATNGHVLAVLWDRTEAPTFDWAESGPKGGPERFVKAVNALDDLAPSTVAVTDLARFAGEPGLYETCDECGGTGERARSCEYCSERHSCHCEECYGGRVSVDRRLGVVGRTPLNLCYLATALSVVDPGAECEVRSSGETLRLDGPRWRIVLMGVRRDAQDAPLPRFDIGEAAGLEAAGGRR